jgi:sulfatase modifying factor 1
MRWIPGGTFLMGSEDFYPEERPVHRVAVDGFWMDERPVTAGEFRRFVRDTRYVSFCERPLDPADYPGADPEVLVPGSLVFKKTAGPVDLRDFRNWWEYMPGAYWKRPEGPGSTINGRDRHPVVHVAYEDAEAYASRAGSDEESLAEGETIPRRVIKGGPHLCAPNYCLRYRPAARKAGRSTPRPATSASAASCGRRYDGSTSRLTACQSCPGFGAAQAHVGDRGRWLRARDPDRQQEHLDLLEVASRP